MRRIRSQNQNGQNLKHVDGVRFYQAVVDVERCDAGELNKPQEL